jgi:hypothetical protein
MEALTACDPPATASGAVEPDVREDVDSTRLYLFNNAAFHFGGNPGKMDAIGGRNDERG